MYYSYVEIYGEIVFGSRQKANIEVKLLMISSTLLGRLKEGDSLCCSCGTGLSVVEKDPL